MKKKTQILFFFIFVLGQGIIIQAQNLVPNPSFEDTLECPYAEGETYKSSHWIININSADYFTSCNTLPVSISIPNNSWGYQYPANGNAYFGFYANAINVGWDAREFFGCKLISPLNIGQKYFVSFKINLSNSSACAIDKIGVLFLTSITGDTTIINNDTVYYTYMIPPSIYINNHANIYTNQIVSDTLMWTTIFDSFIADSAYKYLLFGNFFDSLNINYTWLNSNINYCAPYYYVDDICVSVDSSLCKNSPNSIQYVYSNDIAIYPNPVNDKIYITNNEKYIKEITVSIFNITGQQIKIEKFYNKNSIEIDVSKFEKGVYILITKIKDNIEKRKLIID